MTSATTALTPRESQLLLFAFTLGRGPQATWEHAMAAIRSGASEGDIRAVVELTARFREANVTTPETDQGQEVARSQIDERVLGAVAAYG